jgi:hypothetical protein
LFEAEPKEMCVTVLDGSATGAGLSADQIGTSHRVQVRRSDRETRSTGPRSWRDHRQALAKALQCVVGSCATVVERNAELIEPPSTSRPRPRIARPSDTTSSVP